MAYIRTYYINLHTMSCSEKKCLTLQHSESFALRAFDYTLESANQVTRVMTHEYTLVFPGKMWILPPLLELLCLFIFMIDTKCLYFNVSTVIGKKKPIVKESDGCALCHRGEKGANK